MLEFFREELLDLNHVHAALVQAILALLFVFIHEFLPLQLGSVTHKLVGGLQRVLKVLHVLAPGHLNRREECLFIHHDLFTNISCFTFVEMALAE